MLMTMRAGEGGRRTTIWPRFLRPVRLLLALSAAAAALAVAPTLASACPSLAGVTAFDGHATMNAGAAGGGADPDTGGTETIQLGEFAQGLNLKLRDKIRGSIGGHRVTEFIGTVTGGTLKADDTFDDTGDDAQGELTYDGSVPKNHGTATLYLAQNPCEYKLWVGFGDISGTYDGDPDINPGDISGWAGSSGVGIPNDLKLNGNEMPEFIPTCRTFFLVFQDGCAGLDSGWLSDLIRLYQCHTLDTSGCNPNDEESIGTGSLSWSLRPTYVKKQ